MPIKDKNQLKIRTRNMSRYKIKKKNVNRFSINQQKPIAKCNEEKFITSATQNSRTHKENQQKVCNTYVGEKSNILQKSVKSFNNELNI